MKDFTLVERVRMPSKKKTILDKHIANGPFEAVRRAKEVTFSYGRIWSFVRDKNKLALLVSRTGKPMIAPVHDSELADFHSAYDVLLK